MRVLHLLCRQGFSQTYGGRRDNGMTIRQIAFELDVNDIGVYQAIQRMRTTGRIRRFRKLKGMPARRNGLGLGNSVAYRHWITPCGIAECVKQPPLESK